MNREERRKYNRTHKTNYTKQDFEVAIALARLKSGGVDEETLKMLTSTGLAHLDNEQLIPTGTEVKLNADEILSRKKEDVTEDYRNWVDKNRDRVFHLDREEEHKGLVCLAEDTDLDVKLESGEVLQRQRWLFDLYSDILVEFDGRWMPVSEYDVELGKKEQAEADAESNV